MKRAVATLVFAIFFIFLLLGVNELHDFGSPPSQMDDYIIENAQNETGANNAVTSVVFDYRGYDTLGEATVLFTSILGAVVILRRKSKNLPEAQL